MRQNCAFVAYATPHIRMQGTVHRLHTEIVLAWSIWLQQLLHNAHLRTLRPFHKRFSNDANEKHWLSSNGARNIGLLNAYGVNTVNSFAAPKRLSASGRIISIGVRCASVCVIWPSGGQVTFSLLLSFIAIRIFLHFFSLSRYIFQCTSYHTDQRIRNFIPFLHVLHSVYNQW